MIDAHVHFWNYHPVRDSWITEDMQILRNNFLPSNIFPLLEVNDVQGCIAVQADQSLDETDFLLQLAAANPIIKAVVGWIDFQSTEIDKALDSFSSYTIIKGFRHIAQAEADGFLLNPAFVNGIKALQKHNYSYDILLYAHQLKDAIALADKCPGQRFVLDHCGKPAITKHELSDWKKDIRRIAQYPGMYCKLSGLITEANWYTWKEHEIIECLNIVFDAFGTSRIMFGSDWPVMLLAGNYSQWINLLKQYMHGFSAEEIENVFMNNATHFYNL